MRRRRMRKTNIDVNYLLLNNDMKVDENNIRELKHNF
jgi:hypothetical protein